VFAAGCITIGSIDIIGLLPTFMINSMNQIMPYNLPLSYINSSDVHIAIIGSSGYIGARLLKSFKQEKRWVVVGYDRIFPGQASHNIPNSDLKKFHVVIYLGGLTGRKMCLERPQDVQRENVGDIYDLAKRMSSSQVLIFASTSAIAEGSGTRLLNEDSPVQPQLMDSYSASMFHRENTLRNLSLISKNVPRMIGLRFGTVIGLSPSQRIDLAHMALICQAFLGGTLRVTHPETNRAFLWMEDLLRAVTVLIKGSTKTKRFDLFHLQSFSASISKVANEIAYHTRAHIHAFDHTANADITGFALNNSKFRTTFEFDFQGNQSEIITSLIEHVPSMCLGRQSRLDNDSIPCLVCGSHEMQTVLDLHTQPLANDFRSRKEESLKCERFPLRLVRCPKCHHSQLSHVVSRSYLFSHYLYQSGTSQSLRAYFAWLAEKSINESNVKNGTVLELACNDGTQLNEFSKRGWRTVGVDPARNLAELARSQGHTVYTGFWGVDKFPRLPQPSTLNIIIAQNVLAHVDNPIEFLRACASTMSEHTKLYIQTSQCEMYETGQFDTVYHEHISFFTAHSFKAIAIKAGLKIINFEITPVHGRSCLVTFQKLMISDATLNSTSQKYVATSLSLAIEKERALGATEPWFYVKYQAQAQAMRRWIVRQLDTLQKQGHTIIAYGAAAKGIVLLHYLLETSNRSWNISYVIDDAPLKQNTFCSGTSIPVLPTSVLKKHNITQPLTILVFAWNFWEEISNRIRKEIINNSSRNVFIILPFPSQKLIKLESNSSSVLTENTYKSLIWPQKHSSSRMPVLLISHFFNEQLLLPFWIRHHASMFDMAILIDYHSTDRSREIIRNEAPSTWQVVSSRNMYFEAQEVDAEVKDYEKMYPKAWKIALNTPEFVVHSDLRQAVRDIEVSSTTEAFRIHSIIMLGNDSVPLGRYRSLILQRFQYLCNANNREEKLAATGYSRYIHRYPYAQYSLGRHDITGSTWEWLPSAFLAKFQYTPWPEIVERKLQIRGRVPPNDFARGRGNQHDVNKNQLIQHRNNAQQAPSCVLSDYNAISDELAMIHRLWKDVILDSE
jgi:nucleoside-diphosphate-sugar epimerase